MILNIFIYLEMNVKKPNLKGGNELKKYFNY